MSRPAARDPPTPTAREHEAVPRQPRRTGEHHPWPPRRTTGNGWARVGPLVTNRSTATAAWSDEDLEMCAAALDRCTFHDGRVFAHPAWRAMQWRSGRAVARYTGNGPRTDSHTEHAPAAVDAPPMRACFPRMDDDALDAWLRRSDNAEAATATWRLRAHTHPPVSVARRTAQSLRAYHILARAALGKQRMTVPLLLEAHATLLAGARQKRGDHWTRAPTGLRTHIVGDDAATTALLPSQLAAALTQALAVYELCVAARMPSVVCAARLMLDILEIQPFALANRHMAHLLGSVALLRGGLLLPVALAPAPGPWHTMYTHAVDRSRLGLQSADDMTVYVLLRAAAAAQRAERLCSAPIATTPSEMSTPPQAQQQMPKHDASCRRRAKRRRV